MPVHGRLHVALVLDVDEQLRPLREPAGSGRGWSRCRRASAPSRRRCAWPPARCAARSGHRRRARPSRWRRPPAGRSFPAGTHLSGPSCLSPSGFGARRSPRRPRNSHGGPPRRAALARVVGRATARGCRPYARRESRRKASATRSRGADRLRRATRCRARSAWDSRRRRRRWRPRRPRRRLRAPAGLGLPHCRRG